MKYREHRLSDENFQLFGIDPQLERVVTRLANAFTTAFPSILDTSLRFVTRRLPSGHAMAIVPYPGELGFAIAINSHPAFQRRVGRLSRKQVLSLGSVMFNMMFYVRYASLICAAKQPDVLAEVASAYGVDQEAVVEAFSVRPDTHEVSDAAVAVHLKLQNEFSSFSPDAVMRCIQAGNPTYLLEMALRNQFVHGNTGPLTRAIVEYWQRATEAGWWDSVHLAGDDISDKNLFVAAHVLTRAQATAQTTTEQILDELLVDATDEDFADISVEAVERARQLDDLLLESPIMLRDQRRALAFMRSIPAEGPTWNLVDAEQLSLPSVPPEILAGACGAVNHAALHYASVVDPPQIVAAPLDAGRPLISIEPWDNEIGYVLVINTAHPWFKGLIEGTLDPPPDADALFVAGYDQAFMAETELRLDMLFSAGLHQRFFDEISQQWRNCTRPLSQRPAKTQWLVPSCS